MKNILALDIGSHGGYAYGGGYDSPKHWVAGTWNLATKSELAYAKGFRLDRRLDIRVAKFAHTLENFVRSNSIDVVVFEDVKFIKSRGQAHLWASFRGVIWSFAARWGLDTDCLDVQKLKLFASGRAFATKEDMARAWKRKHPERPIIGLDDNAVDALHLLDWANNLLNK